MYSETFMFYYWNVLIAVNEIERLYFKGEVESEQTRDRCSSKEQEALCHNRISCATRGRFEDRNSAHRT